jgi:putative ABC transport system substrate-binding protein
VPRRTVFALGVILSVWLMALSPATEAQQTARVYRIGILSLTSFEDSTLAAVTIEGLARLGYVVGRNLVVEDTSADGKMERLPALAVI